MRKGKGTKEKRKSKKRENIFFLNVKKAILSVILFPFPSFFSSFPSLPFYLLCALPFPSPPSLSFPTLPVPYFASLPLRSSHHFPVPFLSLSLHFSSLPFPFLLRLPLSPPPLLFPTALPLLFSLLLPTSTTIRLARGSDQTSRSTRRRFPSAHPRQQEASQRAYMTHHYVIMTSSGDRYARTLYNIVEEGEIEVPEMTSSLRNQNDDVNRKQGD